MMIGFPRQEQHHKEKQMKLLLALTTLSMIAVLLIAADGVSGVTYVDHEKVAAALSKGGPLVSARDLLVSGSHRDKAGQVEVHDKETDVIYVVDGTATFVTGGTMVGGKMTTPGQLMGSDIKGGQTHHLSKGDVIVIPARTPHWFKEVPQSVSYYVVKVLKQ
jgi:quercetin dioxygenase-like cupin family protein